MHINQVNELGYLGADPEVRKSQSGVETLFFSLGVTKKEKDPKTGDKVDKTNWFKVKVINQGLITLGKNYLKKGTKVYISGELDNRKYKDKLGNEQTVTEIILGYNSTLQFANKFDDSKKDEEEQPRTLSNIYD